MHSLSAGTWTHAPPPSLGFSGALGPEEVAGGRLTHDHVVADVTESGLLEDVFLKAMGLAAAWVRASPGGRGRQAPWGRERAGAGADLSQLVPLQLHVAVRSLEEVVSTFAP